MLCHVAGAEAARTEPWCVVETNNPFIKAVTKVSRLDTKYQRTAFSRAKPCDIELGLLALIW
jgi:hypothetical protein